MIKLITWEVDPSKTPTDPEERMKLTTTHCEMVKEGINSGRTKVWGIDPGGNHGFALSDADEKEIFATIGQYMPYTKFRVESMLSIDEVIEVLKAAQQET